MSVNRKIMGKKGRQGVAIGIIFNLVLAIFAFSILISISGLEVVSADYVVIDGEIMDVTDASDKGPLENRTPGLKVYITRKNAEKALETEDEKTGEVESQPHSTPEPSGESTVNPGQGISRVTKLQDMLGSKTVSHGREEIELSKLIRNNPEAIQNNPAYLEGTGIKSVEKVSGVPGVGEGDYIKVGYGGGKSEVYNPKTGKLLKSSSKGSSTLSKWLGAPGGSAVDSIISGAQWAGIAYGAGQLIGSLLGLEGAKRNAISTAMAAGFGTGKFIATSMGKEGFIAKGVGLKGGVAPWVPWVGGIAVGLIVLELMWKEESKEIVKFECNPWEAPVGGENCEECNSDIYPCSEYRCRSLGQACKLVNKGDENQKCVWKNPNDVESPRIEAWEEPLGEEYAYKNSRPIPLGSKSPGGAEIVYNGGCVKPFTPLRFGIETDEPSQCKIDYNQTSGEKLYEEMEYYFGESNLYSYNHTQELRLPGPTHMENEAPEIKTDGDYELYVRCRDANGNYNPGAFVFKFCVQDGPDVTPPNMVETSIKNGQPIQYGLNETPIELYVNEPAECRWSRVDQDWENMNNEMECATNVYEMNNRMLYKCTSTLTGLQDYKDNKYYFRCKDQPNIEEADRNANQESKELILKGSAPLDIRGVGPNETIEGYTSPTKVVLEVDTTNGAKDGEAWCSYSRTGQESDYTEMYKTGKDTKQIGDIHRHTQRLDLSGGEYTYYFQCVDEGGNAAYSNTTFKVEIDEYPPEVVRVYKEDNKLKIITDEDSVCSYSNDEEQECDFDIENGQNMPRANTTDHFAEWEEKNYYVKCKDKVGQRPSPTDCSIVVRPEKD